MSGGGPRPQQGPVQQHGGGMMQPGVMTIDPTPPGLRPMQQMLTQAFMQRMQGQGPPQQMPSYGQLPNVFQQLYGTNPFPGGGAQGSGPGAPPRLPVTPPFNPQNPGFTPPHTRPMGMPTYGDIVSGSRLIRSMQPQYTNQYMGGGAQFPFSRR